ncbi:AAA family ATPase [Fimbriiglobus ruber]|uniref:ATPase AAA-type core domain-containing protein n=1 Tax=Fimbriiglobus ruber TaxID=1908690 RepID=A0A225E043_9BACT|nr:ATP-binding protein [Fimbriiglobus ruber]OWK46971.1 hypothetical protein FRUB_00670 [Fimbriiglobus ruber]
MLKSLTLDGIGPVRKLSADFGSRLNVLTGDNGLGKSFLLDVCFWALTGTWPGGRVALPDPNGPGKKGTPVIVYQSVTGNGQPRTKNSTFDFHSQTWTKPRNRSVSPGLVIYAAVDGSFAVWDPARNYLRDPMSGIKKGDEQPKAFQFTPQTLAEGLPDGSCEGLERDWVNWYLEQSINPKSSPFNILESVVSLLSHPTEPMVCGEPKQVFVDQMRKSPVLTMPYGDVPYPQWSAGVRRVIGFAYLLVWTWFAHVRAAQLRNETPTKQLVLIVDELEAHLHPKWQRTILPALLQVVSKLEAELELQVFAATHSPLILASLEPHFDRERDKLFWFDLDETSVHFRNYPWTNYGDVVGWLTSDIFGLQQARSNEAESAIGAAKAFLRGEHVALPAGLKTKQQIDNRLRQLLGGQDPFLVRWHISTGSNGQ